MPPDETLLNAFFVTCHHEDNRAQKTQEETARIMIILLRGAKFDVVTYEMRRLV